MRGLGILCLCVGIGYTPCLAQRSDSLRHWGAAVSVQPGHVVVIDEYQRKWQKGKSNFSLDASLFHVSLPSDSNSFAADYGHPEIGVGVKWSFNHGVTMHKSADPDWGMAEEVDYDSKMGNTVTAYLSFVRPLFRAKRWMADYSLATGIGYSHSTYHPLHAVDNELIGSHWLIYFSAGAHLAYKVAPGWGVRAGVDFWHLSNGALSRPNKGANLIGPSFALFYCPSRQYANQNNLASKKQPFQSYLFLNFSLGIGAKSLNEEWLETQFNTPKGQPDYRKGDFTLYMAYSAQADLMYRYARRWASGLGADIFYGTYAGRVAHIDDMYQRQVKHSPWSFGLALKHHAYYKNLALSMSLGYYLYREMGYNASLIEKPYYERIGLQYTFPVLGGITLGANVKAHLTKADLVEIVVAKPIVFK